MNPELEKYIDFVVADGEVTEKEKNVLIKKAQELNVDLDEMEIVLDAKLHVIQKETQPEEVQAEVPLPAENKPSVTKCPVCAVAIDSFSTRCPYCDAEIRDTKTVSSLERLNDEFQKIEESERSRKRSWIQKLEGDMGVNKSTVTRQISFLAAFPVPNTNEDLLEFLSLASSEAQKKIGMAMGQHPEALMKKAWRTKSQQIITKARFAMKNDKKLLEEIETIAKELKIK